MVFKMFRVSKSPLKANLMNNISRSRDKGSVLNIKAFKDPRLILGIIS